MLQIFHESAQSCELERIGVNTPLQEHELREIYFYNINAVSPYYEDGVEYSSIHSNGSEYICPIRCHDVINMIERNEQP